MVREPTLKPLMVGNEQPLDELGRSLIKAANDAGGRDNITVILFRLEEVDAPAAAEPAAEAASPSASDGDTHEYATFTRDAVAAPRQGVSSPQNHAEVEEDAERPGASDTQEAQSRPGATVAVSAVRPSTQPLEEAKAHAPPRRKAPRRRRRLLTSGRLLALGCVIGL